MSVSLLDMFQMSPDLSKAYKTLSMRVNMRTDKAAVQAAFLGDADLSTVHGLDDAGPRILRHIAPLLTTDQKAFRISVVVKTKKGGKEVKVALPISVSQADQGSDMIIATIGFLKALGLTAKVLSWRSFSWLTMNVADGTAAELTHYAAFQVGVCGIWRKVEVFIRPYNGKNVDEIHLQLGMPWLHAVNANIRIRDLIIEIGDPARGEKIVLIKGPKFVESAYHKLVLHPAVQAAGHPHKQKYAESETDSDESDSDPDMSSEDEGNVQGLKKHQSAEA